MEEVPVHVKKELLEAWILRAFTGSKADGDLILHTLICFPISQSCIPVLQPQLMTDVQDDPLAPIGAIWCRSFDCSQLPTHTLVTYRDQLDFMPSDQEVDDMTSGVIQEPPSSPSQFASFAKKVQTIIRSRCVAVLRSPYWTGVLMELRGALTDCLVAGPRSWRRDGEGSGGRGLGDLGSSYQVEPFDSPELGMPSFSLSLMQLTQSHPPTSYTSLPPDLGFSLFQSPHPPSIGSSSFQASLAPRTESSSFHVPPPPYTVGSFIQHMPISTASSSDSDEHDDEPMDMVTPAQQLGFGHRVGWVELTSHNNDTDIAMWAELTSHNNDTRQGQWTLYLEIAYGAYGPYFTRVVQKAWTLSTNRIISHAQL
ncbi:hypothetical protein M9H77_09549 [Catharanthus roseus]|uniref:Uncharacterized protein n=1 Tax=Catharanthus roseus TaxID=4058 RepID=A0ACC0C199_CATRO|nr:hypothetical protein M9H77_09549 [Catharanthus roseus]